MPYYRHEIVHISVIPAASNGYRIFAQNFKTLHDSAPLVFQPLLVGPIHAPLNFVTFTMFADGDGEQSFGESDINDIGTNLRSALIESCTLLNYANIVYIAYGDAGATTFHFSLMDGSFYVEDNDGNENPIGTDPTEFIETKLRTFDATCIDITNIWEKTK